MKRMLRLMILISIVAFAAMPAVRSSEKSGPVNDRAPDVNPERFGGRIPDIAFGAFQRGLYITAFNLAKPRAEAGDPAAQALIAEIYSRGLGIPQDLEKATQWYKKAAEQGVPEAEFRSS